MSSLAEASGLRRSSLDTLALPDEQQPARTVVSQLGRSRKHPPPPTSDQSRFRFRIGERHRRRRGSKLPLVSTFGNLVSGHGEAAALPRNGH
jgi:hypothetical protein